MLKDLPVLPSTEGDEVMSKAYVSERRELQTAEALKEFIFRWREMYVLSKESSEGTKNLELLQSLIDGTFDADIMFECMKAHKEGICSHIEKGEGCAATHISLPPALLLAHLASNKYEAPIDIAFIQLYGGLGALE